MPAGVTGTAALLCPQAFEFFMNFDEDQPKCRHMAEQVCHKSDDPSRGEAHEQFVWLVAPARWEEFVSRGRRAQANTIIRLYGALILSQSWLVWKTREVGDPFVRKIFVQGYLI